MAEDEEEEEEEEEEEKRENRLRQMCDHRRRHLYRFAVRSRFKVHATAKARRDEGGGGRDRGKSAAKTEPPPPPDIVLACNFLWRRRRRERCCNNSGGDDGRRGGSEGRRKEEGAERSRNVPSLSEAAARGCAVRGRRSRRLNGSSVICGSANRRKEGTEQTVALPLPLFRASLGGQAGNYSAAPRTGKRTADGR